MSTQDQPINTTLSLPKWYHDILLAHPYAALGLNCLALFLLLGGGRVFKTLYSRVQRLAKSRKEVRAARPTSENSDS